MTSADIVAIVHEDLRSEEWRSLHGERAQLLAAELALARRLSRWVSEGRVFNALAGSLSEFGQRLGLGPVQTRCLVSLGCLVQDHPDLESLFLEGSLNLESADLLWQILDLEGGVRDGEDWVAWAVDLPTADLRKRVEMRLAEIALGGPVRRVGLLVTAEVAGRFRRARTLASRRAGRPLSRAEAFGEIVTDYLVRHDPLWKREPRRRRVTLASDSIPAAEKRAVRRRFGDRCAVDGCTNEAHLELAHVRARALGGANTEANLLLLCSRHHRMFDAQRIFLRGDAGARRMFVDRDGRFVAWLREAPVELPATTGPPG
jgi:hypothetical protein